MFSLGGGVRDLIYYMVKKKKIDESISDSSQVHRAKELYMSGAKQLQIMNNLREPGIVTGCTGQGVTGSRGLGFTING